MMGDGNVDKGLEKLNQSKPAQCDDCGGKMVYKGIGEYECSKCGNVMYDDYGKVRRYIDEHGASSILILERETGVSKEVLEYLIKDGTLTQPPESIFTNVCNRCGYPIVNGRYCKACMMEMANELAGVMKADQKKEPKQVATGKNTGARMHLTHRRRW